MCDQDASRGVGLGRDQDVQLSFFNTEMTFARSNPMSVNETTLASARPAISASVAVRPDSGLIFEAGAWA